MWLGRRVSCCKYEVKARRKIIQVSKSTVSPFQITRMRRNPETFIIYLRMTAFPQACARSANPRMRPIISDCCSYMCSAKVNCSAIFLLHIEPSQHETMYSNEIFHRQRQQQHRQFIDISQLKNEMLRKWLRQTIATAMAPNKTTRQVGIEGQTTQKMEGSRSVLVGRYARFSLLLSKHGNFQHWRLQCFSPFRRTNKNEYKPQEMNLSL